MKAIVRTTHDTPKVVARALKPDHTADMTSTVNGNTVETTIERTDAGSVRATVDDYLVNLQVATRISQQSQTETMTSTEHTERDNE